MLQIESTSEGRTISGTLEVTPPSYTVAAHLGAPIVATANRIVTSTDFANGAMTIAAQPDTPRNLTATLTDANSSVTAGTLTINGLDPQGNAVQEVVGFAALRAGWTGTKIFASVTSLAIAGVAGATAGTDVIVVGVGSTIGLPSNIVGTQAIKHVYLGGARIAVPVVASGDQTSGVDASAATYNGSKALQVYYSPLQ